MNLPFTPFERYAILGITLAFAAIVTIRALRGDESPTNPTAIARRRYATRSAAALLLSMGVFVASDYGADAVTGVWRVIVALTPLLPLGFALAAMVLYVREMDELQRQRTLESLGIAVAATAFFSLAYGLLEGIGAPHLSMWWTWSVLMGSWAVARLAQRACNV